MTSGHLGNYTSLTDVTKANIQHHCEADDFGAALKALEGV